MKRWAMVFMLLLFSGTAWAGSFWDMPKLPPPEEYGNLLLKSPSENRGDIKPAIFSHWLHRTKFTCRVCHFELDFLMKANASGITEEANRNGQFCGACHDGKTAFDHSEKNCSRCHTGDRRSGIEKFRELARTLPKAPFGNRIDWIRAIRKGLIKPKESILEEDYKPMPFKKMLRLEAEWTMVPPAYFSHKRHGSWLDCANCHPDIFNIKKKTTKHFEMIYNLQGKFCGACHLSVAFPMHDCKGCHPAIKEGSY